MEVYLAAYGSCLSADTPPGYFTSGGSTSKCAAGSYRDSWATGSEASSCQSCGTGVFAAFDTQIEEYSMTNPNSKTLVGVTTSPSSCCELLMQQHKLGALQSALLRCLLLTASSAAAGTRRFGCHLASASAASWCDGYQRLYYCRLHWVCPISAQKATLFLLTLLTLQTSSKGKGCTMWLP